MVMEDPDKDEKPIKTLSEEDVRIMQTYGAGPYSKKIKKLETDVKEIAKRVNEVSGIKESDTGLAHPSRWDLVSDKQMMQEEHPLQVSSASHPFIRLKHVSRIHSPHLTNTSYLLHTFPLQVARCTKIVNPGTDDAKYLINIKQIAKFVVGLGEKVAPTDIEEGMRVG
jgi:26S proteasome regulatory subunit T1